MGTITFIVYINKCVMVSSLFSFVADNLGNYNSISAVRFPVRADGLSSASVQPQFGLDRVHRWRPSVCMSIPTSRRLIMIKTVARSLIHHTRRRSPIFVMQNCKIGPYITFSLTCSADNMSTWSSGGTRLSQYNDNKCTGIKLRFTGDLVRHTNAANMSFVVNVKWPQYLLRIGKD